MDPGNVLHDSSRERYHGLTSRQLESCFWLPEERWVSYKYIESQEGDPPSASCPGQVRPQPDLRLVELLVADLDSITLVTLVLQEAKYDRCEHTEHEDVA